jgi:hypothetical protein
VFGNAAAVLGGHRFGADIGYDGQLHPLGVGRVSASKGEDLDDRLDLFFLSDLHAAMTDERHAVFILNRWDFFDPAELLQ